MREDDALPPTSTPHVADEVLADYTARRLGEWDEVAVEEHLAACDACSAVVRASLLVADVWDRWTALGHGEASLAERLARAVLLASERSVSADWQARLSVWAERWSGRAEAAVRVVMDAQVSASRVVTEGLDVLSRPGSAWQFALVPVSVPTRGTGPGGAAPSATVALAAGATQARVAVGGARREVVVRLDNLPADRPSPLVLLVPLADDGFPRLALPERVAGVAYLVARFADVPLGEYVVAFEPQSIQRA